MTDLQALIERCENACAPGVLAVERRRVLREVAAYLRELAARDGGSGTTRSPVAGRC